MGDLAATSVMDGQPPATNRIEVPCNSGKYYVPVVRHCKDPHAYARDWGWVLESALECVGKVPVPKVKIPAQSTTIYPQREGQPERQPRSAYQEWLSPMGGSPVGSPMSFGNARPLSGVNLRRPLAPVAIPSAAQRLNRAQEQAGSPPAVVGPLTAENLARFNQQAQSPRGAAAASPAQSGSVNMIDLGGGMPQLPGASRRRPRVLAPSTAPSSPRPVSPSSTGSVNMIDLDNGVLPGATNRPPRVLAPPSTPAQSPRAPGSPASPASSCGSDTSSILSINSGISL